MIFYLQCLSIFGVFFRPICAAFGVHLLGVFEPAYFGGHLNPPDIGNSLSTSLMNTPPSLPSDFAAYRETSTSFNEVNRLGDVLHMVMFHSPQVVHQESPKYLSLQATSAIILNAMLLVVYRGPCNVQTLNCTQGDMRTRFDGNVSHIFEAA
ncbi:hypothetical protein WG66_014467 [Moniliophthora roreri]|nr:hypothetical protein WG66_014467 [Moniliophthora roreri]